MSTAHKIRVPADFYKKKKKIKNITNKNVHDQDENVDQQMLLKKDENVSNDEDSVRDDDIPNIKQSSNILLGCLMVFYRIFIPLQRTEQETKQDLRRELNSLEDRCGIIREDIHTNVESIKKIREAATNTKKSSKKNGQRPRGKEEMLMLAKKNVILKKELEIKIGMIDKYSNLLLSLQTRQDVQQMSKSFKQALKASGRYDSQKIVDELDNMGIELGDVHEDMNEINTSLLRLANINVSTVDNCEIEQELEELLDDCDLTDPETVSSSPQPFKKYVSTS